MLPRWSRALTQLSRLGSQRSLNHGNDFYAISRQSYAKAAAAVAPVTTVTLEKGLPTEPMVNLDKLFWSKPCSLALPPDSPLRIDEPQYEGIKRMFLRLMLFYSKQSKSIRGANVVYKRVISQVDKPAIYEVFNLEKTFKTTYALLVLHMWLCLRRLKQEGKEGVEFGQYVYEIYNHDMELRVSKAGVNLLLTKWMKDLEKIFYGNIIAYDAAMLPEARQDDLQNVIWRNVFSDDGSSKPDAAASRTVQAMSRYVRREVNCLSLTDKEAMFSGNFMFTPLKIEKAKWNSKMLPRWSRALTQLSRLGSQRSLNHGNDFYAISRQSYAKAAAAVAPVTTVTLEKGLPTEPMVNLDKLFWSKPCSLALPPDSPLRIDEPQYEGIKRMFLRLMLFYSKQSKSIRGANVVYKRVISQVDKPAIYEVFNLEKTFKTTYALLVLHMWLCLRRLKQEGKEGVEFGQYVYEIYNHDMELRVSKAGVNLLLTKWMKDLEKIFYGNIIAYDAAMLPEARQDDLQNVIWRNVFSDDGSSKPDAAASRTVQAMSRYVRREVNCLSLTDKEAMFSGNFMFTPLKIEKAKLEGSR